MQRNSIRVLSRTACWFIALLAQSACAAGEQVVTFSRDIAPIVYGKCAACHHPGEAAPFSLLSYDDARRRATQIAEVTRKRIMPPWLPQEGHGEFVGGRHLTDAEIQAFADWAAAGATRGDASTEPKPPQFTAGWQLGEPDLVLQTPAYTLRGEGRDQFRNFVVPIELKTPQWVEAIELRPENPRVTHHARLGIDTSGESVRRDAADPEPGYDGMAWGQDPDGQLVTWAPGMVARSGTPGTAWRLYPKTSLVLHTHMQPSGKEETVRFRIGIHFTDKPPTLRPVILRIGSRDIDIPAGDSAHEVTDEFMVLDDIDVHYIFPHAHSLCREIHVDAELPDGTQKPLIAIERFDEKWHDVYRYVEPVRLPRGAKLITRTTYDNSDANTRNRHHPPQRTVYGSNVDDEMQDIYLQVTAVRPDQRAALVEDYNSYEEASKIVGFQKALAGHPDDPWSREGLAAAEMALGKPNDAVKILEQRLKLGPRETHTVAMLGMAALAAGEAARAEDLEREALKLDEAYPLAWLGLGKTLMAQQKHDEAEVAYRRAVELAPALTDASLNLADVLMQGGKLDAAAAAANSAIAASPEDANAYLKLAEIRTRQQRVDESLKLLGEAQRLAPYTHPPKVLQAAYLTRMGDTEQAAKLLEEARREQPDHPVPLLFLGQLAIQSKHPEEARRDLDAAASLAMPDNWPASHRKRFAVLVQTERFKLAQQLQDVSLARDAVGKWIGLEPTNKELHALAEHLQAVPNSK